MILRQLGELPDQFRVQPAGQAGVHPPFLGLHAQRVQPRYLGGDEHVGGHIHERAPPPQADRLAQEFPGPRFAGGGRVAADGLAAPAAQGGEAQHVNLIGLRLEGVARVTGDDAAPGVGAQNLPQALDVVTDGDPGTGGRRAVPDDLGQLVVGGDLACAQRQGGQDHPLLRRGNGHRLTAGPDQ